MNDLALPAAAKAYIALAGSVATALLGVFAAESTVGKVLTVVAAIATGVGTWAVPNKPAPNASEEVTMHKHKRNEFGHANGGYYGPVGIVVLVILILILLAVVGVIG